MFTIDSIITAFILAKIFFLNEEEFGLHHDGNAEPLLTMNGEVYIKINC